MFYWNYRIEMESLTVVVSANLNLQKKCVQNLKMEYNKDILFGENMNYTLITRNGNTCKFYLREMAETYRMIYGGVIVETKNNSTDIKNNTNKG